MLGTVLAVITKGIVTSNTLIIGTSQFCLTPVFCAARPRAGMSGSHRLSCQRMSPLSDFYVAAGPHQPPNKSQSSCTGSGSVLGKHSSSFSSRSSSREICHAPSASLQRVLRAACSNASLPAAATEATAAIAEAGQQTAVYRASQTPGPMTRSPTCTQQEPQLVIGFAVSSSTPPRRRQQQPAGEAAMPRAPVQPGCLTLRLV